MLLLPILASCGTYSHLRPADPVGKGRIDFQGGLAVNNVPEFIPVFQLSLGLSELIDVGAQTEVYSTLGWLRVVPFNSMDHGVAVAFTGGAGKAFLVNRDLAASMKVSEASVNSFAWLLGMTVGRRWQIVEPYVGYKILLFPSLEGHIQTLKLGTRIHYSKIFLGVEAGVSNHHRYLTVAEGTVSLGAHF